MNKSGVIEPLKVCLLSLGCKVNQAEISTLQSALSSQGHEVVRLDEMPELCIINTCTVTAKSDYQSRQLIRRARKAGARVIVTGCYSELNKEQVGRMEGVEAVIKNNDKDNIINMLAKDSVSSAFKVGYSPETVAPGVSFRARFFLKVQDGCSHACSYCLIPRARGRSRSIRPSEVIVRVNRAVSGGYKEVVLTGIHLGLYGLDLKTCLSELLEEILEKTEIQRIRLSSLEIKEINDRLLSLFSSKRLARHLHIPMQSGDNRILRLMNRNYDSRCFSETVKRIKERLNDIALGTDIIAGFPGEGEEEFKGTMKMVNELPFTYIHVFPFSERPGTKAAVMSGRVAVSLRRKRASALRRLAEKKKRAYMLGHIGKTLEVLIEEKVSDGIYSGTSSNYLKVHTSAEEHNRGNIVLAGIEGVDNEVLVGKSVNRKERIDF